MENEIRECPSFGLTNLVLLQWVKETGVVIADQEFVKAGHARARKKKKRLRSIRVRDY
jgi:hypothetical protein